MWCAGKPLQSCGGANFAGSASIDDLIALAPQLADAGLHAELWTDGKLIPDLEPLLSDLPVPVVIDHMGGFRTDAGVDQAGFAAMRRLLGAGRVWVKLCVYRNLLGQPTLDAGRVFQDALIETNPQQLVWGSDWPHLRVEPAPHTDALLAHMSRWADASAPGLSQQILVDNPRRLYL